MRGQPSEWEAQGNGNLDASQEAPSHGTTGPVPMSIPTMGIPPMAPMVPPLAPMIPPMGVPRMPMPMHMAGPPPGSFAGYMPPPPPDDSNGESAAPALQKAKTEAGTPEKATKPAPKKKGPQGQTAKERPAPDGKSSVG